MPIKTFQKVKLTKIRAKSGSGAVEPPTTVLQPPKAAANRVANDRAARGELIITGNCSAMSSANMMRHVTDSNTISSTVYFYQRNQLEVMKNRASNNDKRKLRKLNSWCFKSILNIFYETPKTVKWSMKFISKFGILKGIIIFSLHLVYSELYCTKDLL